MCINLLKLNDDKTKFIVIGMAQQLKKIADITVKVRDMKHNQWNLSETWYTL